MLAVLGDRYRLPVGAPRPQGEVAVAEAASRACRSAPWTARAGSVVAVRSGLGELLRERLDGTASLGTALDELAGSRRRPALLLVARTGWRSRPPSAEVTPCSTPPTHGCLSG